MKLYIKAALLFIIGNLLMSSCEKDDFEDQMPPFSWRQVGLDGLKVNRLELIDNNLYAITEDGLYIMDVETEDEFSLLGLKGKNILDIVVFDEKNILASYRKTDNWAVSEIYETKDGGMTWAIKEHNFGHAGYTENVLDFFWDGSNSILYATSYGVLAKSVDQGTTWQVIWGAWGNLGTGMIVEMNPYNTDDLWFGGQGGIENGFLVKMQNEEVTGSWSNLVPNPTVPKEIIFDSEIPQNIYVGWEGELNKTSDYGDNWETLIDRHEKSHFFFGIGVSKNNPDLIFSGKWIKGVETQPLLLHYSKDGGATWQEETNVYEDQGGIFDLKIISSEDQERIFLALDKGGVYEVVVNTNKI